MLCIIYFKLRNFPPNGTIFWEWDSQITQFFQLKNFPSNGKISWEWDSQITQVSRHGTHVHQKGAVICLNNTIIDNKEPIRYIGECFC